MFLEEVDQAAWGGDDEVATGLKQPPLSFVVHAAEDCDCAQAGVDAEVFGVLGDLDGQFPCGCQSECERLVELALDFGVEELMKHRHQEDGGLSGASLRASGQILSLHGNRQCKPLDRSAFHETQVIQRGTEDFPFQGEFLEEAHSVLRGGAGRCLPGADLLLV